MQKIFSAYVNLLCLLLLLASCGQQEDWTSDLLDDELTKKLTSASPNSDISFFELPEANDYNNIPQDPRNPLSEEKVNLGKFLFHETSLGTDPFNNISRFTYSCASCHHVAAGFQAGKRQGIGEGGLGFGIRGESRFPNPHYKKADIDVQPIRSPSSLHVAFQNVMLWNGQFGSSGVNVGTATQWTPGTPKEKNSLGFEGAETQAIAALGVHRLEYNVANVVYETNYKFMFDQAFPYVDEAQRYSHEMAGLAIAAYERTLMATESPFQQWLKGDRQAMTTEEKRGAILFFGKANCVSCHTGPALSSVGEVKFYALGMKDLLGNDIVNANPDAAEHKGRGGFTQQAADMYKFKVPQLYNLKDSPFYGHGGTFFRIEDVITYKNKALPENSLVPDNQLAKEFVPLGLNEEEIEDISAFIRNGLYDPHLDRYVPASLFSDLCFPNNDAQSKKDLQCE